MQRQFYACLDHERGAPFPIEPQDATKLNERGYGIFWSVNEFGERRRISELKRIYAWYCEMDGDKESQRKRIERAPLVPSLVVESKNGFHCYWHCKDQATLENWASVQAGLISFFSADEKAKDVTRILRVPGFKHLKNPDDPFMVREVFKSDCAYTEKAMLYYFRPPVLLKQQSSPHVGEAPRKPASITATRDGEGTLNEKLSRLNNMTALQILSGKACVNHEVYDFRRTARGRHNILVNGKSTSCFIDENNKIGATPGGPTVWQWLAYYGHANSDIARILKDELGV
jgi:hypothetical protein